MEQVRKVLFVIIICLGYFNLAFTQSFSSGRKMFTINDGWKFQFGGNAYAEEIISSDAKWENVLLPHTWNAHDPFDDDRTYKRGIAWYRKELLLDKSFKEKKVYLYFEGVNQVADVFVNGAFAGRHKGGYTAFAFDVTDLLKWKGDTSKNLIAVQVNNAHDPFIGPLSVGYAIYGGIYRDAWVITTDKLHFKDINNNSSGVYISTPSVSNEQANIAVKTIVQNETNSSKSFQFLNTISDQQGKTISTLSQSFTINAGEQKEIQLTSDQINNPHLWSPAAPYLYKTKSQLIVDGKVMDEVSNATGFRWFSFDPNNGFSLNGKKLQLRGTNRHQDMQGKGAALTSEDHERDMKMIKEMGCNFVRLAHYPQAPKILQLADELGLLIWEEIPLVNYMTINQEFLQNGENMLHEMMQQGYNHPSVIMWGSMNEILLYSKEGDRVGHHSDTVYIAQLKKFSLQLDSMVRKDDPSRYSTLAMHLSSDYDKFGLDKISQIAGHNIYSGWYSGKVEDFSNDLDRIHSKDPKQNIFISEYGAEGETGLNTEKPIRFDYTTQYQRYYHESYLRQINSKSYLAGTAIWNEFDFSQPNIGGPAPNMNQKGMATWDRKPKDVYYLYKANWNPEPMVYIAAKNWLNRAGEKGAASTIDVYSNVNDVTLFVNGEAQKSQKINDIKKCSWQVRLKDGKNIISATGKMNGKLISDEIIINYNSYNANLSSANNFKTLSVNVGSNAQYSDKAGNTWVEDQPYNTGSFGYINGIPQFFMRSQFTKHTNDVPLYYMYRDSLTGYRFDVPDGNYKLTLYFSESKIINAGERIFDVMVNDETLINNLDLTASYGFAEAVVKSFIVKAKNSKGININFNVKKGSALLSGVKVEKSL